MLQVRVLQDFETGDEVTLTATVIAILPSGRARVGIPSYNAPYAVEPPPKTRAGDRVFLVGDIIRIDRQANRLTVRIDCGGVVTVDRSAITSQKRRRGASAR
ncbi:MULTISPECIES: hypothetical protein [unclassified Mesorhizobium]|uniref:hypothetical protein n=1 Tax=unclassified Mesorhizobium TaxID=325217 RepID=UPI003337F80A